MKFAKNRLYIEKYVKCPNCGILIFEDAKDSSAPPVVSGGKRYCSSWCVEWEADRRARREAEAAVP